MSPLELGLLAVFGVAVGIIGALVGAGGGFLIVPVLLLVVGLDPKEAVATSSCVVAVSSASALVAYAKQGRVDRRLGFVLAAVMVPGLGVGAWLLHSLPKEAFGGVFGVLLLATSAILVVRGPKKKPPEPATGDAEEPAAAAPFGFWDRRIDDALGVSHRYRVDMRLAVLTSAFIGLLPALFGIGGGIVGTPVMVVLLGVPIHVAAATSQLVIAITALITASLYIYLDLVNAPILGALATGVFIGAPIGARLAQRTSGRAIAWILSGILALVSIELILRSVGMGLRPS